MAEPKANCTQCGRQILQRTADRNDGLCAPCLVKARATPPAHFALPEELTGYLISVRKDPDDYLAIAWQMGADAVYGYVARELERDALFEAWSPRLREFAEHCRQIDPPPSAASLSSSDQARQLIYEKKIEASYRPGPRPCTMTICRLPLLGIPVAERLWPGQTERVVILTADEVQQWNKIYSHPESAFWWIERFWWAVEDAGQRWRHPLGTGKFIDPLADDIAEIDPALETWIVESGHGFGDWFGSDTELWTWDGQVSRRTTHTVMAIS